MTGKNKKTNQVRYINTITSRISDSDTSSLDDYINWCSKIVKVLEAGEESHDIFKRFAVISKLPPKYSPTYLFAEFEEELLNINTDELIREICVEIKNNLFKVDIDDDVTHEYMIGYHYQKH